MLKEPVSIMAMGSVSALGSGPDEAWKKYLLEGHYLKKRSVDGIQGYGGFLPDALNGKIGQLADDEPVFKKLDRSVLFALIASRNAVEQAGWRKGDYIGINIGSSRGATGSFEHYHQKFLETGKAETLSSPNTTLGNISSWVAQDLQSKGPAISHSVTCSTGLHAVLNGLAWINSGMSEKFLAGGSEASLTAFTMAQVQAMKIHARKDLDYPCQALNMEKRDNSMVLGEGAAVVCMEMGTKKEAMAMIRGVGYAVEPLLHPTSISREGTAFQDAMRMALGSFDLQDVDVIVMHAPGTIKGDISEVNAINAVFGQDQPALTTNKWKIGHTFGASGTLSLELALQMLRHQVFIPAPSSSFRKRPGKVRNVLVNAIGFGGNAVSVLLSIPPGS